MRRGAIERRIRELQQRIRTAREEIDVLTEQIEALAEDAEEARVRSLVAETPLSGRASTEAHRHLELAERAVTALRKEISECVAARDRLLGELPVPNAQVG